jgi:hypothetical protein
MITFNKWYPLVHPLPYDAKSIAFEKAVKRVEEEYRLALECLKKVKKTEEYDVELYNKKAWQNTVELGMVEDRKRFSMLV